MVEVFREVRRVLRDDGTLWLNLGDSYNGSGGIGGSGKQHTNKGSVDRPDNRRGREGLKPKDLVGIPWRVAFALQADGWYLRQDLIWHKPNPMPESVTDRCTKAHEYLFLLSKRQNYYFDTVAMEEPAAAGHRGSNFHTGKTAGHQRRVSDVPRDTESHTRNRRSVWTISTKPYLLAHFAVFPPELVEPCILAGTSAEGCCPVCGAPWERLTTCERVPTRPGVKSKAYMKPPVADGSPLQTHSGDICGKRDPMRHCTVRATTGWQPSCQCPDQPPIPCTVLDPFMGSGTTAEVAQNAGRRAVGIELNPEYCDLIKDRFRQRRLA
jgi:DNA modification methylase